MEIIKNHPLIHLRSYSLKSVCDESLGSDNQEDIRNKDIPDYVLVASTETGVSEVYYLVRRDVYLRVRTTIQVVLQLHEKIPVQNTQNFPTSRVVLAIDVWCSTQAY